MATEKYKTNWQKALAQTRTIASEIRARRGDEPLKPTPEEVIQQMREERDEELERHLLGEFIDLNPQPPYNSTS